MQRIDSIRMSSPSSSSTSVRKENGFLTDQGDNIENGFIKKEQRGFWKKLKTTLFSNEVSSTDEKDDTPEEKSEDEKKSIAIRFETLKDRATSLCAHSKFSEAYTCFEQLLLIEEQLNVKMLLLLVECCFQLDKKKTEKNINKVKDIIMTSSAGGYDVINAARELIVKEESHIRALVLLRISSDLFKDDPTLSPEDKVRGFHKCVEKVYDSVSALSELEGRSKVIAVEYGQRYMKEILKDLREMDAETTTKTLHEAQCVLTLGLSYISVDEYRKCIKIYKSCIEKMEDHFNEKVSEYRVYGQLLYWLGIAKRYIGRNVAAEEHHKKAIDALNNATDFPNEADRQTNIEFSQTFLKEVRKVLKKYS